MDINPEQTTIPLVWHLTQPLATSTCGLDRRRRRPSASSQTTVSHPRYRCRPNPKSQTNPLADDYRSVPSHHRRRRRRRPCVYPLTWTSTFRRRFCVYSAVSNRPRRCRVPDRLVYSTIEKSIGDVCHCSEQRVSSRENLFETTCSPTNKKHESNKAVILLLLDFLLSC